MALAVTPVPRNLATKVTFLYLEFEDLFVILGLAVVMNMFGRFLQREMFGIPMNVFLQYVVPVLSSPALILFNDCKPGGYLDGCLRLHMEHARALRTTAGPRPSRRLHHPLQRLLRRGLCGDRPESIVSRG